jgi:hypothetical protein
LLCFTCRELGQDERLAAAGLLWARMTQPMAFWDTVAPAALRPSQQQQLQDM